MCIRDRSGIRESYFHLADERAGKKLLYKIVQSLIPENTSPSTGSDLVSADNLFRFQSAVIRRLAQEESCIFIGRCADHVLAGTERLVRIFIYADMEARICLLYTSRGGRFVDYDIQEALNMTKDISEEQFEISKLLVR